jgi:membrane protease YdiL (CAAX protease family)
MRDNKASSESAVIRSVVAWAALLFALTVLGGLPLFLGGLNLSTITSSTPHLPIILTGMLVSSCAPTLAALFVAGLDPDAGGIRSLLRQVRIWRVGIAWYALAIIGPIFLFLIADVANVAAGATPPERWLTRLQPGFGPGSTGWVVFGSLFAEELGWRGFAQPRLQRRFGALRASILIGLLWATWHLWPVVLPGGRALQTPEDAVATYIRMVSTAIVYAWMYNSTNGSLFLVMVAHFGHNLAASVVKAPPDSSHFHLTLALLYLVVAVCIVLTSDSWTLTRGSRRPVANRAFPHPGP